MVAFSTTICSIDTPPICYEKILMTVKGYPKLTIKSKPINPLNYFVDPNYLPLVYHTLNSHEPTILVSLPCSRLVLLREP